jgi:serine/threonine protein kinase
VARASFDVVPVADPFPPHLPVWSYGVVVYEALTHSDPFPDMDKVAAAAAVAHTGLTLTLPSDLAAAYPIFREMMKACFMTDPQQRPDFNDIIELMEQAE